MGPGTKDRVRRLLGLPDDLVLAVIGREQYAPPAATAGAPADGVGARATEQEAAGR